MAGTTGLFARGLGITDAGVTGVVARGLASNSEGVAEEEYQGKYRPEWAAALQMLREAGR
jgi:hypothetical protein